MDPSTWRICSTVTPGLVDLHDEHGQAAVLGDVPVGAGQAHGVVGVVRRRAPDLRAVQDEDVAVAVGAGEAAGQVGAAAGLGEELHPQLLALQDRGEVARFCSWVPKSTRVAAEDAQRGHVEREGHVVRARLLGEGALVLGAEAQAAVLGREADPGEPAVPQRALQLTLDVPTRSSTRSLADAVAESGGMLSASQARARSRKSSTGSRPPAAVLLVVAGALTTPRPAGGRRCARRARSGCRGRSGSTVARRRYRWRSCSQVTPMPPWSWTQSWISSVAWGPTQTLATLTSSAASGAPRPPPGPRRPRWRGSASSHILSSARRCLSAWYDDSGRPKE